MTANYPSGPASIFHAHAATRTGKTQTDIVEHLRYILRNHQGKDRRITRGQLVESIFGWEAAQGSGRDNFDRAVREAIEAIRDTDLICSTSGAAGYWIAESMEDIELIAGEYERRSKNMLAKASDIRRRGREHFGPQMPLGI